MVSFTGFLRGGTSVTRDVAQTVERVTLELGGRSPNIVFADFNLEECALASLDECIYNTGQLCDAATRLLFEKRCYDEVPTHAKQAAENIAFGNHKDKGFHIGLLFDRIQLDWVQKMISVGIEE